MQPRKALSKAERKKIKVLNTVAFCVFFATLVFGACMLFVEGMRDSGILIALVSIVGVMLTSSSKIVWRLWQVDIPFSVLLIVYTFVFLAVVPGELFGFYYIVWWWDVFLHIFSGFGITYILYLIMKTALARTKHKQSFVVIFVLLASLGCAAIWEITEFAIDSVFQTNMQKVIPPEYLPNNTGSIEELEATDSELANYYRQPKGYRYAVTDTMWDHISYLLGTMLWLLTYRLGRPEKNMR